MASISAVLPAFNAEDTIGEALRSVLSQTAPLHEVIVVDDGSKDGTAEAARTVDSSVRVESTTNRGVSAARNRGADLATADFVAFLDADDMWRPEKLASQEPLLSAGAAMSTTGTAVLDAAGAKIGGFLPSVDEDDQPEALLTRFMTLGTVSSAVVDRGLYCSIGGCSTALQQCADWDLFLRVAKRARIEPLPELLTVRRVHESNMSHDIDRLAWESRATLDRYFADASVSRRFERRVRGGTEAMLAGSYFHTGRRLSSLRCVLEALKYDPRVAGRFLQTPAKWVGRGGVHPAGFELQEA
jgi:glycosyltransferase involved in cell wall biosynthesis